MLESSLYHLFFQAKEQKIRITARFSFHFPFGSLSDRVVMGGYFWWSNMFMRIVPTGFGSFMNFDRQGILQLYHNSVINCS
jgi:hypothetical protein